MKHPSGSSPGGRIRDQVLTVPNVLTFSRLLAIPAVLGLLFAREDLAAAIVFVAAAVTDFLDGKLARRKGGAASSRLGAILDPVVDRLMLSSTAVVLAMRGLLPDLLVVVLVGRDALTLLGSLVFRGKIRVNRVGKAATTVLMASVAVVMYGPGLTREVGEIMFYTGLALSLVAGVLYLITAKRLLGVKGTGGR